VATLAYSSRALSDIETALTRWNDDPQGALKAATAIRSAVENLAEHPLLGRRIEGELRELIVSRGPTGYVAVYRFLIAEDEVHILVLTSQRELGFTP
jgi:plasmid stabilization system protein ParE